MKTITTSSPQEAVLEWLKAELNSARFSSDLHIALQKLDCDEKIITEARLDDSQENETRWQVLKTYRTWLDRDFTDYEWQLVELSCQEVAGLSYIDYSYWNELSDNTRKVGQAVKNVASEKMVFDVPNDGFFSVAKGVEAGVSLPPIIVVSDQDEHQGEILEGHLRATGYVLARQTSKPLRVIWGKLNQ